MDKNHALKSASGLTGRHRAVVAEGCTYIKKACYALHGSFKA